MTFDFKYDDPGRYIGQKAILHQQRKTEKRKCITVPSAEMPDTVEQIVLNALLRVVNEQKRSFYAKESANARWSVHVLRTIIIYDCRP